MNTLKIYISSVFIFIGLVISAQQTPANKQSESILISGATIHIGNGQIISNGAIGLENGKITFVDEASKVESNKFSKTINANGKHIYPGFIAINTTLGIGEIDAVRATNDNSEIGGFIPHVRSLVAYNAESKVIETMRPNGVLIGQIVPRGGYISGTSSVVQFDAWNWEDAVIKADDAIHLNWPRSYKAGRWWLGEDPTLKPDKNYTQNIEKIKVFLEQAKAYIKTKNKNKNLPYEAVRGLFDGSQKLYINANYTKEITDAIDLTHNLGVKKIVLVNGINAHKVTDILKQYNIPVIIERAHSLPHNDDDNVKLPYKMAKILSDKGIMVTISNSGDMERMSSRNLPFYAGTCAAYGLEKEKAVQLITENAAKILGIDSFTGTLEMGKDATLFISEGDALDMRTNNISLAFIQGREISLESHQTKLWNRYSDKYKKQ